jgi:phospholipid transport system transporter-binding protein
VADAAGTARLASGAEGGALRLTGELTFATVPQLWTQGERSLAATQAAGGELLLDLSGVTHSDSAGLALLVAWQARAQAAGFHIGYRGLPDNLRAVAQISAVDTFL